MSTRMRYGPRFGQPSVKSGYVGDLPDQSRSHQKISMIFALDKERAKAGDKKAKARVVGRMQKLDHATKLKMAKRPPAPDKAPRGFTRMTRRDPDTGRLNTVDMPGNIKTFDSALATPSRAKHFGLQPWQLEFLTSGRYKPPKEGL